jgi:osmoprotectant transport system ATP-binding protein
MLELHGVSKRFGETQALAPTDLVFPRGKTTALLGPSGCGKSTLLRIIVGLLESDTGSLHLDGVEITRKNLIEVRRRMGYVIQDGGLFPHLTCRANVALMARYLGWKNGRIEARMQELAQLTHLPPAALDRFPTQISGGQRQRVSLMRALFLDPDLMLLDEPMAALDPLIRSELQHELREIFRKLEKTAVMVSHDIGEAGFLGDRLVLLRGGRIVQMGTLEELVRSPAEEFVTAFVNAQRSPLESVEAMT